MTTLLTAYDERMRGAGDLCAASLKKYGPQMGCRVAVYKAQFAYFSSWSKLTAIKRWLNGFWPSTWIVWIDADCLLRRPFDLLGDIAAKAHFDMLCSTDWNGVCLGVFALKRCAWSLWLLDTLVGCGDVVDDDAYGRGLGPKHEQNALKALMASFPKINRHIGFLDSAWITDKPCEDRQFNFPLHHFGGLDQAERLRQMSCI